MTDDGAVDVDVTHTPFGVLVVRPVDKLDKATLLARLHPEEAALAATWGELRVRTFTAGRLALRAALAVLADVDERALAGGPVRRTARGAPDLAALPAVVSAARVSVSHKDDVAVALASHPEAWPSSPGPFHLGVDVELFPGPSDNVAAHVLTAVERAEIDALPVDERRRSLVLRFSAKEALYKAIDPFVQRYVGFLEVEARIRDEAVAFSLALKDGEGPFVVDGAWRTVPGGVVTMARARKR